MIQFIKYAIWVQFEGMAKKNKRAKWWVSCWLPPCLTGERGRGGAPNRTPIWLCLFVFMEILPYLLLDWKASRTQRRLGHLSKLSPSWKQIKQLRHKSTTYRNIWGNIMCQSSGIWKEDLHWSHSCTINCTDSHHYGNWLEITTLAPPQKWNRILKNTKCFPRTRQHMDRWRRDLHQQPFDYQFAARSNQLSHSCAPNMSKIQP